jgi:predicted DNA-binding transcriptional regulator AlpA
VGATLSKSKGNTVETLPRFLTEQQVADRLALSVKTLQRWRLLGQGPRFRKFGGAVRYSVVDIETWMASTPSGGSGSVLDIRPVKR